jgi:putative Ig domain-containing protein
MKLPFFSLILLMVASQCMASIAITTKSLPNGTVETAYSAAIKASGGCTPYSWAIVSGSLPAGIRKKTSSTTTSLILSGTPTAAASYSFTVAATGCGKSVSKMAYRIVIQKTANHVVDLSWKASTSTNIAGYNVYRSPDASTWKRVNASLTASTRYSDSSVANGSTYYYATTAVNISGKESSKTTPVKVVVP